MGLSIYLSLTIACLLGLGVTYGEQFHQTNPVSTTMEPQNDTNSTLSGFSVTDYVYIDFHKIGYQIFLRKMIEAFRLLHLFMKMDPVLLKMTKTYLFTNETDSGYNATLNQTNETTSEDSKIETNTESPNKYNLLEPTTHTENKPVATEPTVSQYKNKHINIILEKESSKEAENEEKHEEEIEKTKVVSEGFFSKAASYIVHIFHSITNWF